MANNTHDSHGHPFGHSESKPFMRWALPQLPNGSDIARLVEQKVITPEEARQICFRDDQVTATSKNGPIEPPVFQSTSGHEIRYA